MITRIVIPARVRAIDQKFERHYIEGQGDKAIFETVSHGWFVTVGDACIFVGDTKPELKVGQEIKLIIEGDDHADT